MRRNYWRLVLDEALHPVERAEIVAGVIVAVVALGGLLFGVSINQGTVTLVSAAALVLAVGYSAVTVPARIYERVTSSLAVDSILLEPFPDGRSAFLKVTNQGPAGTFRARLLTEVGLEYYLGWEDGQQDHHLLTGETGNAHVARQDRSRQIDHDFDMSFYEAGEERPVSRYRFSADRNEALRATVLSEHGPPVSIDLELGIEVKPASWDQKITDGDIVLRRGVFKLWEEEKSD